MNNTWIGKSIGGRYHIEELLGQGGMSAVYKATDPNLKRVVAVKMIHAHLSSDAGFVARFEEEATAVAKLRHPNIVQVYDYDHDDQVYYMVLEFVPGETLQEHLKRLNESDRKLPIKEALKYAQDISNAADYAHHRGMIHRDIKPANVMLSVQGDAILMDFGIAKIIGGQRHTATGAVVGTAMYMSPEQIKGEQPDRRTDIYSLGVMLYEMVSGHPPYEANSAMTLMMMHVNDPIPDVRQLNPEVPSDLVAVINKALAKNPGERYQTAAELSADLKKVQDRIAAGAEADTLKPGATRVEDLAGAQAVDATRIEPQTPQNAPGRTYVEQTPPIPPQGTAVERPSGGSSNFGRTACPDWACYFDRCNGAVPAEEKRSANPAARRRRGGDHWVNLFDWRRDICLQSVLRWQGELPRSHGNPGAGGGGSHDHRSPDARSNPDPNHHRNFPAHCNAHDHPHAHPNRAGRHTLRAH